MLFADFRLSAKTPFHAFVLIVIDDQSKAMKILYTALGPLAVLLSTLVAVRSEEGRRNRGSILHQMQNNQDLVMSNLTWDIQEKNQNQKQKQNTGNNLLPKVYI